MGGFTLLPSEIRLRIWLLSIPDDEAEVCLPWPLNVPSSIHDTKEPLYTLPCQPMTVDVAFPVAMHVCRESRSAVRRSGVRFRASQAAGCPTPFREFRPELDVLYLGCCGIWFMHMFVWPDCSVFDNSSLEDSDERSGLLRRFLDTLLATRRFAVDAAAITGRGCMIKDFFTRSYEGQLPRPTGFGLCYVVPTTKNPHDMDPDDVHATFVPPGRRCRLAGIDKRDWGGVLVPTKNVKTQPLRTLDEIVTETLEELRAAANGRNLGIRRRFPGPDMMDIMDVSAGTFVEYQRDGTWTEACAARMYSIEKMGLKEIALDERPDPEVHRVHDADVELRLVRWDISDEEEYYDDEE